MKQIIGVLILLGLFLAPGVAFAVSAGSVIPALIVYGFFVVIVGLMFLGVWLIAG